jgi:hypothetical protein
MTVAQIERRLAALEADMAVLKAAPQGRNRWWDKIAGTFSDNPLFDEAMREGRKWREEGKGAGRGSRKRQGGRRGAQR